MVSIGSSSSSTPNSGKQTSNKELITVFGGSLLGVGVLLLGVTGIIVSLPTPETSSTMIANEMLTSEQSARAARQRLQRSKLEKSTWEIERLRRNSIEMLSSDEAAKEARDRLTKSNISGYYSAEAEFVGFRDERCEDENCLYQFNEPGDDEPAYVDSTFPFCRKPTCDFCKDEPWEYRWNNSDKVGCYQCGEPPRDDDFCPFTKDGDGEWMTGDNCKFCCGHEGCEAYMRAKYEGEIWKDPSVKWEDYVCTCEEGEDCEDTCTVCENCGTRTITAHTPFADEEDWPNREERVKAAKGKYTWYEGKGCDYCGEWIPEEAGWKHDLEGVFVPRIEMKSFKRAEDESEELIPVGTKVRSYDFWPHDETCYKEGVIVDHAPSPSCSPTCMHYHIRTTKVIRRGKSRPVDKGEIFMTHPYADMWDQEYPGQLAPHIQVISTAFPSTSTI